jgi:ubiquinone/menaquinone biosynthesis C-methylase UbiE
MTINKEATIKCYDALAPLYTFFRAKTIKTDNEIMPFVLETLRPADGDRVLDAGTGPGVYAIRIAGQARNADVHGIDLSPAFIKIARANARKAGCEHIRFDRGDIEKLPFEADRFDKLICAGALEAVPNREQAAREFYRVLKPGGTAVIIEPDQGRNMHDRAFLFLLYGIGLIRPKMRGFGAADIKRYYLNKHDFRMLFDGAGFSRVELYDRRGSICAVCVK